MTTDGRGSGLARGIGQGRRAQRRPQAGAATLHVFECGEQSALIRVIREIRGYNRCH
jgi:hypothetical protein